LPDTVREMTFQNLGAQVSTILVAEDDAPLNRLFCTVLGREGFTCVGAGDGEEALELLQTQHFDLLICDVLMPCRDGLSLTRTIRALGIELPILIVTAAGTIVDKERGFLAGADDYLVKPVDVKEMVLRVRALLRRSGLVSQKRLLVGVTELDLDGQSVSIGGKPLELPMKEFGILRMLLSHPGKIFTRRHLMDELWEVGSESEERTVDVHVSRLRDRFRGSADFEIVTVRGLGYKAVVS